MKKYYDILKDLREDRDLDQKTVAKAMGIDTSYYGKYERGVHPLPIERLIFAKKLDIENPIIRINTAFKGCSSLEKISVLPRIYHN